ncbi:MAG: hypothetical protein JKY15_00080 [Deltaproteobacteria bacterium]|nr:hypothetical protein [Deltaproteobacteria bacterium]
MKKKLFLIIILVFGTQSLAQNLTGLNFPTVRQLSLMVASGLTSQLSNTGWQGPTKFTAQLALGLQDPGPMAIFQLAQHMATGDFYVLSSALTMANVAAAKLISEQTNTFTHESWLLVALGDLILVETLGGLGGLPDRVATQLRDFKITAAANSALIEYLKNSDFTQAQAQLCAGILAGGVSVALLGNPIAIGFGVQAGLNIVPGLINIFVTGPETRSEISWALGFPLIFLADMSPQPDKTLGRKLARSIVQATGMSFLLSTMMNLLN